MTMCFEAKKNVSLSPVQERLLTMASSIVCMIQADSKMHKHACSLFMIQMQNCAHYVVSQTSWSSHNSKSLDVGQQLSTHKLCNSFAALLSKAIHALKYIYGNLVVHL